MGLFWDLIQQNQISDQRAKAESLENRVLRLENELNETRRVQTELLKVLEEHFGKDINRDGKIG